MQKLVLMDTTYICGAFHPFSYQIFESYTHVTSDLLSFFGALLVRKKVSWMKNKHTHTHIQCSRKKMHLRLATFHWTLASVKDIIAICRMFLGFNTKIKKNDFYFCKMMQKVFIFLNFWPEYWSFCLSSWNSFLSHCFLAFYFLASAFLAPLGEISSLVFVFPWIWKTCSLEHGYIAVNTQKPWMLNYPSLSVYSSL